MADEKAPLLTEQAPPPQGAPYTGQPQAPPPQGGQPQAPPSQGGQPQAPPPQGYTGQPQAPPPQGGQPQAPPPQGGQYGTYQPAPSYQNAPPPAQNTTVVVQPGNVNPLIFGENPVQMTCPNCRVQNRTTVAYTAGLMTWLLVGALVLFGFCLCAWVPLLIDGCKDVTHICPNCQYTVGTYKRI